MAPAKPPAAPPAMAFETTAALIQDPTLAALVDGLAGRKRIESSHIGAAGAPSEVFASFEQVRDKATPAQLLSLLRHQSPVVRGYVAQHVIGAAPKEIALLEPLLADAAPVPVLEGCAGGDSTVADLIVDDLCWNAKGVEADALLVKAASLPASAVSERALGCLASRKPDETLAIARSRLSGTLDDPVRASVLTSLAATGRADACPFIAGQSGHASPAVRRAVAQGLAVCKDASSLAVIDLLRKDSAPEVAEAANRAYLQHPGRDPGTAKELLSDDKRARANAMALASKDTPEAIAAVEQYVLAHPKDAEPISSLISQKPTEARTAMIRRLAGQIPVSRSHEYTNARSEIVVYLYQLKDPKDLPEMRKSLLSWGSRELDYAFRAVTEQKDRGAISTLQEMAAGQNELARRKAEEALEALKARPRRDRPR